VHAYRKREELRLNALERFLTKGEIGAWSILVLVGSLSVFLAFATEPPGSYDDIVWPGWIYMLLAILMPIYSRAVGRRSRRVERG
ncbi:MAG: hypothetical protein ACRELX_14025, partial [Longimicrobiales bacterium]